MKKTTKDLYWLSRDCDGEAALWDGRGGKPVLRDRIWLPDSLDCTVIDDWSPGEIIGRGFHGVEKGGCSLIEVATVVERTVTVKGSGDA